MATAIFSYIVTGKKKKIDCEGDALAMMDPSEDRLDTKLSNNDIGFPPATSCNSAVMVEIDTVVFTKDNVANLIWLYQRL